MPKKRVSRTTSRPLLALDAPIKVRVYRGKFKPFEATRYLDLAALKSARKATVECGTIEVAGLRQTVAAEIRKGMVVALRPVHCEGCAPRGKRRTNATKLKKAMKAVRAELAARGIDPEPKPIPLKTSSRLGFQIPIGPIIIIIGDPAPGGVFDLCIEWSDGRQTCWWCLFGESGCMTLGW